MSTASIAIITDAWFPQINGVVNTLVQTGRVLTALGHRVDMLTPENQRTFPCPTYPEIRLSWMPYRKVAQHLDNLAPVHIHIATEGPLGLAARKYCLRNRLEFTTSYHTQFPEYIRNRVPVPLSLSYTFVRRFHNRASCTMVATPSQERLLEQWGFNRIVRWSRGVDTSTFNPDEREPLDLPRPIFTYAGRVAVEKNLDAFLGLELPGSKCVIGDGPALQELRKRYPRVSFTGYRFGRELSRFIAAADVFVFPSRTDTFGLVMLEAMACGVPVVAFPVTGAIDVIRHEETGILDNNLARAALAALDLSRDKCREYALEHTWEAASMQFLNNLVPSRADGCDTRIVTRV